MESTVGMSVRTRIHPVVDMLDVEEHDYSAGDEESEPRRVHCPFLPGMSDKQAGQPDYGEERHRKGEVLHVVNQQESAPARGAAVEPLLQPQKGHCDGSERKQQAALIIARPRVCGGKEGAHHGKHCEDQELHPEAEPRPESAFRVVGRRRVWSILVSSAGGTLAHFGRKQRDGRYNRIPKGSADACCLSPSPQPSLHARLEPEGSREGPRLPADGLIIDLEDAVAAEAKEGARAIAAAALAAGGYGPRELVLRVNPLDSPWGHADLAAAATMPIDAVLLPKVESADRVRLTVSLLDALGAPELLAVWSMIETPRGVLTVGEIAAASPRLTALVLGTSDLTKELHALSTRDRVPLITALGLAVLAARAHGLAILDGVHLDLADEEGFVFSCRQGRELGFDGRTLIHPKQIAPANIAYAPSAEEIEWSRRVIAVHAEFDRRR